MENRCLLLVLMLCSPLCAFEQESPADILPEKRIALLMLDKNPSFREMRQGMKEVLAHAKTCVTTLVTFNAHANEQEKKTCVERIVGNFDAALVIGNVCMQALLEHAHAQNSSMPIVVAGGPSVQESSKYQTQYPITWVTEGRQYDKQIELLKSISDFAERPATSVLLVYDPVHCPFHVESKNQVAQACEQHNVEFKVLEISNAQEIETMVPSVLDEEQPDVVMTLKDVTILSVMNKLADMCAARDIPLYASNSHAITQGAAYAFSVPDKMFGHEAASMLLQILDEGVPANHIPVKDIASKSTLVMK